MSHADGEQLTFHFFILIFQPLSPLTLTIAQRMALRYSSNVMSDRLILTFTIQECR